jgi:hypothetical protein
VSIERLNDKWLSKDDFKWQLMKHASFIISESEKQGEVSKEAESGEDDKKELLVGLKVVLKKLKISLDATAGGNTPKKTAGMTPENIAETVSAKRIEVLSLHADVCEKIGDYEDAKRHYTHLKLMLGKGESSDLSKSLQGIDKRLDTIESRIRSSGWMKKMRDIDGKEIKEFILMLMAMLVLTLVFYFFDRKFIENGKTEGNIDILKAQIVRTDRGEKLIDIGKLRQLDGRVSEDALLNDKTDPNARLIRHGHKMIEEANKLAPLPLAVVQKIPGMEKLPHLISHTVVGFTVSGFLALVLAQSGKKPAELFYIWILLAAFITLCLQGLKIMASATINSLDEIICMMEPKRKDKVDHDPVRALGSWIRHLFRSPWQIFIGVFFLFIISVRILFGVGDNADPVSSIFVAAVVLFFAAPIIWMIFGSIATLNKLSEMRDIDINPLSPIKTMGLEKWNSVISVFNVACSIVLTFGCSIGIIMSIVREDDSYDPFWFIMIIPLLVFYWIYPHLKLGSLVKSIKTERMQFLKTRISSMFNDWIKAEEMLIGRPSDEILKARKNHMDDMKPQMDNFYEVFKKIDESPHSYMNIYAALELLKALGIPSLFALASALLL